MILGRLGLAMVVMMLLPMTEVYQVGLQRAIRTEEFSPHLARSAITARAPVPGIAALDITRSVDMLVVIGAGADRR